MESTKSLELLSMQLNYFKGIKSLKVDFTQETNILGDNAVGKTTLVDAFNWLFFGVDSSGNAKFNIKTLDESGAIMPKLEHEVSAMILADGDVIELRRVLVENWVKKRGSNVAEFTGNQTKYFYDDVPCNETDYNAKINAIINKQAFKLTTSTKHFNEGISWQERRAILVEMAGDITNEDILAQGADISVVVRYLEEGKTIADAKKQIASKKSLLKKEIQTIPARIDEVERSMPEPIDEGLVNSTIATLKDNLSAAVTVLQNKDLQVTEASNRKRAKENELAALKGKLEDKQHDLRMAAQAKRGKIKASISAAKRGYLNAQNNIADHKQKVTQAKRMVTTHTEERDALYKKWDTIKAEEINPNNLACPTCGTPYKDAATAQGNFEAKKVERLSVITEQGKAVAANLKNAEEALKITEAEAPPQAVQSQEAAKLEAELAEYTGEPDTTEILNLKKQIADFKITEEVVTDSGVNETIAKLKSDILVQEAKLTINEQIGKFNLRIEELNKQEQNQNNALAALEGEEYSIKEYEKARIDLIQGRINGLFNYVTFKMFETQINGGEKEVCEVMVNGVPYNDVNYAGKVNAGIDVINALSKHYGVSAPIWVDNRESITTLEQTKSQVINLIKTTGINQLKWN